MMKYENQINYLMLSLFKKNKNCFDIKKKTTKRIYFIHICMDVKQTYRRHKIDCSVHSKCKHICILTIQFIRFRKMY